MDAAYRSIDRRLRFDGPVYRSAEAGVPTSFRKSHFRFELRFPTAFGVVVGHRAGYTRQIDRAFRVVISHNYPLLVDGKSYVPHVPSGRSVAHAMLHICLRDLHICGRDRVDYLDADWKRPR